MNPCDHTAAGVLLYNPAGELLLLERRHPPLGMAPPATHLGDHPDLAAIPIGDAFPRAAMRVVTARTGLTVTSLTLVVDRHADNRCNRTVSDTRSPGHFWRVFTATATADLSAGLDTTETVAWHGPAAVEALANRTVARARGELSSENLAYLPGLEPIWVWWLHQLGKLPRLDPRDVLAVLETATRGDADTR